MLNEGVNLITKILPENNRIERIWFLAKTDFLKRYYGSFLGLVWAIINPLAQLFIYYYVFTTIFENRTANFGMFIFLGIVIWFFFVESTNRNIGLIPQKRYILENIQINKMDIYVASLLSTFFAFLFNFSVFFISSLFYDIEYSVSVLLFPVLLINLLIFIFASNIILSVMFVYMRDIRHLWSVVIMMLFWVSGIIFVIDPSQDWRIGLFAFLTPIVGIISNSRAVLIYNEAIDWTLFVYDFAYALVFLAIALYVHKRYSSRVLEIL